MPQSHRISIRVHTPLLEWIEQQALEGESPSKVVQRLIKELAASDGVAIDSMIAKNSASVSVETIKDMIDERIATLEATMTSFEGNLKRIEQILQDLTK